MSSSANPLLGRPHSTARLVDVVIGGLLLALCVGGLVVGAWKALIVLPIPLVLLSDLRRKVTVDSETLVAQGRFTRRSLPLAELTQVAISPFGKVWVAAGGTSFLLAMVAGEQDGEVLGVQEFPPQLRARAQAAGAQLEPAPDDVVAAPDGTPALFSR